MSSTTITITVDEQAAKNLAAASPEDRKKMEALIGAQILELTNQPSRPLGEIMDEMARTAAKNGLTPEVLAEILKDE